MVQGTDGSDAQAEAGRDDFVCPGCRNVNSVQVVDDPARFRDWLNANTEGPYGLDCETVGVDPTEESPVGKGSIVCWSLAWVDPALGSHPERGTPVCRSAFLWASALDPFRNWLVGAPVVGHNIFGFDRHVYANHGIRLQGIAGDTLRMSKLLDTNRADSHSLKALIKRAFGYGVGAYEDLFSRRKPGIVEDLGEPRNTWRKLDDLRVPTVVGGQAQRITAVRDLIPLDTVSSDYPGLVPLLIEYAALDAKGALELYFLLRRRMEAAPWRGLGQGAPWGKLWEFYEKFWHPSLYVLNDMERRGICYDANVADAGKLAAVPAAAAAATRAYAWIGREINLDSPAQLGQVLYQERFFEIPPVTGTLKAIKANKELKPSTSEAALVHISIEHPADKAGLDAILEERKLTDLIQFLDKLPNFRDEQGRIHSIFSPDTRTGRLSSKKPNLQNIPKDDTYGLRSAFVAKPGHRLVVADYAALEPRIQAHFLLTLFKDGSLLEALNTGDVYSGIARECWADELSGYSLRAIKDTPRRAEAKVVLLAKAYGKGLRGMALQLKKPLDETKAIVDRIEHTLPGLVRFQRYMAEYAREFGGVHTLLGRFRPLPDIYSKDRSKRSSAERQAGNTPMQGSAMDIVTAAMLKLDKLYPIVLQVHDELIVEPAEDEAGTALATVTEVMENPLKPGLFTVPLIVDAHIGKDWAEAKGG